MTISNWSRRPAKLCHFVIPIVPELSGGADRLAQLARFAREWIDGHSRIDQGGYKKACVKISDHLLVLEAIFYPAIGEKARELRAEFTVMIMAAAKRFNLCLMPAEVRTSSPWPTTDTPKQEASEDADDGSAASLSSSSDLDDVNLDDLMPSPGLTIRSGHKPKDGGIHAEKKTN